MKFKKKKLGIVLSLMMFAGFCGSSFADSDTIDFSSLTDRGGENVYSTSDNMNDRYIDSYHGHILDPDNVIPKVIPKKEVEIKAKAHEKVAPMVNLEPSIGKITKIYVPSPLASDSFKNIKIEAKHKGEVEKYIPEVISKTKQDEVNYKNSEKSQKLFSPNRVYRLIGDTRYDTNKETITFSYLRGDNKGEYIVVNGEKLADSLSAINIANKTGAKLYFLKGEAVPDDILNAKKVIIVGGYNSISRKVESDILESVHNTKRIAGSDRYETNKASLLEYGYDKVAACSGENIVDSLSVAPLIREKGLGLYLVKGEIPKLNMFKVVYTIGGYNSVKNPVGKLLAGETRFDTNKAINNEIELNGKVKTKIYVDGYKPVDALSSINLLDGLSEIILSHNIVHMDPNTTSYQVGAIN